MTLDSHAPAAGVGDSGEETTNVQAFEVATHPARKTTLGGGVCGSGDVIKNFVYLFFRVRVHSVFGRSGSSPEERLESGHGLWSIWFDGAGRSESTF